MVVAFAFAAMTAWLLYSQTRSLFRFGVDDRLRTVAAVAAAKFDPAELASIRGPEAVGTPTYEAIVRRLQETRDLAEDIRFVYLLRRTEDPNTLAFVADADSLDPYAEVDLNGDGVVDDEDQLTVPGDPYDVSGFPEFRAEAFLRPFVDPVESVDAWGTFVSGTAPVWSKASPTVATEYVLGLDMDITRYEQILGRMLVPIVAFIGFLLLLLTTLAVLLTRMWDRQVMQLEELDRQKDDLLHIVSHQLAAPVTTTKFFLETLLDGDEGPLTNDQRKTLGMLQNFNAELSDLVGMILDVARIQLGRLETKPLPLDLREFFDQLVGGVRPRAEAKSVALRVSLPEAFPPAALDKRLTKIAIENLLTNAVKYTPPQGHVDLRVDVAGSVMTVTVADTGCGIPKAEQSKIFDKQFRASNVRNAVEGNGFGLYAAKGAAEAQGGAIAFVSKEGAGTTFTVTLPLRT